MLIRTVQELNTRRQVGDKKGVGDNSLKQTAVHHFRGVCDSHGLPNYGQPLLNSHLWKINLIKKLVKLNMIPHLSPIANRCC